MLVCHRVKDAENARPENEVIDFGGKLTYTIQDVFDDDVAVVGFITPRHWWNVYLVCLQSPTLTSHSKTWLYLGYRWLNVKNWARAIVLLRRKQCLTKSIEPSRLSIRDNISRTNSALESEWVIVCVCVCVSHSTHNRSFRGRTLQARWPNQQCQSTEGNQLVVKIRLESHRTTPPFYNNTTLCNRLYAQRKGPNVTNPICLTCKNCSHKCAADCEHCVTQSSTELFW